MRLRIREIDDHPVLAGADRGKRAFLHVIERLNSPKHAEVLFLDFDGVELASASFLRESVLSLKNWCRRTGSQWFPVVANANEITRGDLQIVCALQSDAIIACDLDTYDHPSSIMLIGDLEEKQRGAFECVQRSGGVTARELMEASDGDRSLSPTAWNNRLNVLVSKGIVMETSSGRAKIFYPVLKEPPDGN